jgi:cytochrome c oxidase cbb3-type subunit 2
MKGVTALFLGIFGTFAFSWAGLTLIPNWQIGHLDPQADEEQTDIYPMPKSGMAERGRKIYAANGCVYCHSQQVRADYAASDIDRKWGTRRSAPRDYLFERPVMLGKMRVGPDLSNIGKRAPAEAESPAPSASPAANVSPPAAANPPAPAQPNAAASPNASPAPSANANASPAPSANANASPAASANTNASPTASANASASPTASAKANASPAPSANASPAAAASSPAAAPNAPAPPPATSPAEQATTTAETNVTTNGVPPQYSAAWHHQHLYDPRSVLDETVSNMPSYKFLYEKRRITGERSADALKLTGNDAPGDEWEIVPTYDAKCLVAYLMSLDQSHELKEAKTTSTSAAAASPAAAPATSPAPAKEEKK